MRSLAWADIQEFIASGDIINIQFPVDFQTVMIEVANAHYPDKAEKIRLIFKEFCYFNIKRIDTEVGDSSLLDAYIHTSSTLIDDLLKHKLDSKLDCLALEANHEDQIYHVEVIGDLSIDILSKTVYCETQSDNVAIIVD